MFHYAPPETNMEHLDTQEEYADRNSGQIAERQNKDENDGDDAADYVQTHKAHPRHQEPLDRLKYSTTNLFARHADLREIMVKHI